MFRNKPPQVIIPVPAKIFAVLLIPPPLRFNPPNVLTPVASICLQVMIPPVASILPLAEMNPETPSSKILPNVAIAPPVLEKLP